MVFAAEISDYYMIDDYIRFQVNCNSKFESFIAFVSSKELDTEAQNRRENYIITLTTLRRPFFLELESGADLIANVILRYFLSNR